MTNCRAVVWMNHDSASILRIRAEGITLRQIRFDARAATRGGGAIRGRHGFFAEICDDFRDIRGLLLTGPRAELSDFRHFVLDHRPQIHDRVVGYQAVDHADEKRLVELARRRFAEDAARPRADAAGPTSAVPTGCRAQAGAASAPARS